MYMEKLTYWITEKESQKQKSANPLCIYDVYIFQYGHGLV